MRSLLVLCLAGSLCWNPAFAGKKKNKEEVTQTLEVPPDPPPALVAETRRIVFHTSPLAGKGLLSQQTREAVRGLLKANGGLPILKLRAFVAGTGDLRRVPQIIGEIFAERKHTQVPAVSVIQAGGLPLEGAQVVLEAVSIAKREVNPRGLVFVSAQEAKINQPLQPLAPLAETALRDLHLKFGTFADPVRVTCFASTLDNAAAILALMSSKFPGAALDLVQTQRAAAVSSVACEGVGRTTGDVPSGDPSIAAISSERIVLTGAQVAYGFTDNDARLAFQRMERALTAFGAGTKTALIVNLYPLSGSIAQLALRVRSEFVNPAHPPAGTTRLFEGLPGMDASFAVEAVAPAQP